ncbi:sm LSM1B [Olea europaea subsp. europaea]|uniref:Sm LSM1B n=1 Tax=Olea europaea subsp. europaea TaxID=158383 RepID=A0A8S0TS97_OLEEU|nr:sm LSM1B [Olea europaea subsp. europaea]
MYRLPAYTIHYPLTNKSLNVSFVANAVLEGACERVIVGDLYCDILLGLYVIRGENVVLIGELDLEKEELPSHMTRVSEAEIKRAQKVEREASELKGTMHKRMDFLDMD